LLIYNTFVNFCRCRYFYKIIKNELSEKTIKLCKILVEQKEYKIKVPNKSYDVEISSMQKTKNAICIESNEYMLLFFSLNYFGIFQEVINPFVFIKKIEEFNIKFRNINIIKDFEIIENEQNSIYSLHENKYGIKKLIIPLRKFD
jgi:hypothetical protein